MSTECITCKSGCNVTCDSCNECVSCQTLCELNGNCPQTFAWGACVQEGEIIGPDETQNGQTIHYFNRSEFQKAKAYINAIQSKGEKESATQYNFINYSTAYLSAEEFNDLAKAASNTTVNKNAVIEAKYFIDLGKAVHNFTYTSTQCDWCNTGCDTCNSCNGTCNTAETYCCYTPPPSSGGGGGS